MTTGTGKWSVIGQMTPWARHPDGAVHTRPKIFILGLDVFVCVVRRRGGVKSGLCVSHKKCIKTVRITHRERIVPR